MKKLITYLNEMITKTEKELIFFTKIKMTGTVIAQKKEKIEVAKKALALIIKEDNVESKHDRPSTSKELSQVGKLMSVQLKKFGVLYYKKYSYIGKKVVKTKLYGSNTEDMTCSIQTLEKELNKICSCKVIKSASWNGTDSIFIYYV